MNCILKLGQFTEGGFDLWWAQMDSNQRPDRYERPALTN